MKTNEELISEYHANPTPRKKEEILKYFENFLFHTLKRYSYVRDFDDTELDARLGLSDAIDKFNPSRGVKFSTYAINMIHFSIKHGIRNRGFLISMPAGIVEMLPKVRAYFDEYVRIHNEDPSPLTMAEDLEYPRSSVAKTMIHVIKHCNAINASDIIITNNDGGKLSNEESIDYLSAHTIDEVALEDKMDFRHAMNELTPVEKQIVKLYHINGMTGVQIAQIVGCHQVYVGRILKRAMRKLETTMRHDSI